MATQKTAVRLIVGLGNPGPRYEETRHNAGFWFADEIARRNGALFRSEAKFHGALCKASVGGAEVLVLKPDTFMNRSGQAIGAVCRFYKIPAEAVLVAHDELDIPAGSVRLKRGGGHGGHNGLRDTIRHLGREFLRLRLGIDHPGHRDGVVDYVLTRPAPAEREGIEAAIDEAVDSLPQIVSGELDKAMNRLHGR